MASIIKIKRDGEWISVPSIKGDTGAKGDKGDEGERGPRGYQGEQGPQGETGPQGPSGYTPIRGTDYWTAADKHTIISEVEAENTWDNTLQKPFSTIGSNLVIVDGVLSVDTTNVAERDNTKPITSAGTYAIVGNIETLLSVI